MSELKRRALLFGAFFFGGALRIHFKGLHTQKRLEQGL